MGLDIKKGIKTLWRLKMSEEKYHILLKNIDEIVYNVKLKESDPFGGNVQFVSTMVEKISGYQPREFSDNSGLWFSIVHPDDVQVLEESTKKIFSTKKKDTREYRIRHKKSREYLWIEDTVIPQIDDSGKVVGIFGVVRDITERKKMREVLQESEARFRTLVEASPNGIFESDAEGHCIYVNKQACDILEVSEEEVVNKSWAELMHPVYRESITSLWYQTVKSGGEFSEEFCFKSSHGKDIWVFVQAKALRKKSGEVTGYIGEITDITKRKKAEATIRESEERYRDLFDNIDDIVYTHDLKGNFKTINHTAEQLLGFEKIELLKMNISDLVDARDSDHIPVVLSKVLREGAAQGFELWLTSKDGQKIPFEGNASLIREDDKPVGIRAILRNISDRKEHEEELMQKLMKYRLEKGRVYLTFDRKFNDAEDLIEDAINSGFRGVIISRTNPSEIRRRFGNHVTILWLSKTKSDKVAVSPELSKLTVIIKELASPYTLVFLDRLDYLITQNGFDRVLRFIQSLNDILYFEKGVLVISVDPKTLKPKELSLLENEVTEVELKHRLDISTDLLEILRHVYKQNKQGKSPSYKEIGRKFEITKGTVRKRINTLKDEGLIVEKKRGRFKILELSDEGKALF